jgi:hypothetical protein
MPFFRIATEALLTDSNKSCGCNVPARGRLLAALSGPNSEVILRRLFHGLASTARSLKKVFRRTLFIKVDAKSI